MANLHKWAFRPIPGRESHKEDKRKTPDTLFKQLNRDLFLDMQLAEAKELSESSLPVHTEYDLYKPLSDDIEIYVSGDD